MRIACCSFVKPGETPQQLLFRRCRRARRNLEADGLAVDHAVRGIGQLQQYLVRARRQSDHDHGLATGIDAKIAYKITPNIDVFIEGRNLGNAATSDSQGSYVPFSNGAPSILDYSYAGRRIMTGVNFRFGG